MHGQWASVSSLEPQCRHPPQPARKPVCLPAHTPPTPTPTLPHLLQLRWWLQWWPWWRRPWPWWLRRWLRRWLPAGWLRWPGAGRRCSMPGKQAACRPAERGACKARDAATLVQGRVLCSSASASSALFLPFTLCRSIPAGWRLRRWPVLSSWPWPLGHRFRLLPERAATKAAWAAAAAALLSRARQKARPASAAPALPSP